MKSQSGHSTMFQQYRFRVKGQLDPKYADWFGGLTILHTPDGDTLLTGEVVDQAALYGIVSRFRDFGVTLISVNPIPATNTIQTKEVNMNSSNTNSYFAEASHVIDVPAHELYAIVSDYRVGHPAILPKAYFADLTVLEGGQGEGTRIRFDALFMGMRVLTYNHVVHEPQPGRVLTESDENLLTTFTFDPLDGGQKSRVTIKSVWKQAPGIKGYVDRLLNPSVAQRVFKQELQNLADYARSRRAS